MRRTPEEVKTELETRVNVAHQDVRDKLYAQIAFKLITPEMLDSPELKFFNQWQSLEKKVSTPSILSEISGPLREIYGLMKELGPLIGGSSTLVFVDELLEEA
jgi:hypothetical protein